MSRGALIVGGSVAGLQAALDLADSGIRVHLVEPTPFLGNGFSQNENDPSGVPPRILNTRLLEVAKHPRVTLWTQADIDKIEEKAGHFRVELHQSPRYVDLAKCTACGDCIEVCPVTVPGTNRKAIYGLDNGQPGCVVIDKLGPPPCSHACPGGIHVQGYVALIAEGRFQEAIDLIHEAIPFPAICGRICTHPCEIQCRRAEVDNSVSIRLLKRFVSDWEWEHGNKPHGASSDPPSAARPERVAIVGAGPGGMTTADRLARLGYQVTVFEKLPVIGGMMAVGIPEYRLPRDVISREYQQILDLGVEVRLDTAIGPKGEHSLDDLFTQGYGAVLLAIGAHKSRALRIAGEELPGVVHGIDLLRSINLSQQSDDPRNTETLIQALRRGAETRVAVLGGGNTAMDVSRSLRRFGIKDVRILYRRTRNEMPALPEEIEDAELEGVTLEYLVSPLRVLGDTESGVVGLECQRMKLGEPDDSSRRRPIPINGSEFTVDLDLVILAIGQTPDLSFLGPEHGLSITRAERIQVDPVTLVTNRPGVFAAGDVITQDRLAVIEAIGMGKQAAIAIDAYLSGKSQNPEYIADSAEQKDQEKPVAKREMSPEELTPKPRVRVPTIPLEQRVTSFSEVELGYAAKQAIAEAQRCLVCGPCSECQACVHACEPGAVIHQAHATTATLDIGAIIHAGGPGHLLPLPIQRKGVYCVPPQDALMASSAAGRAMIDLFTERWPLPAAHPVTSTGAAPRVGVFVCQCGDEIAGIVDTEAVCVHACQWPAVVHAQTLSFSCSPDAADVISKTVKDHDLNRVVLAACSCCSFDQVCYSCTYQRVRCKDNLGMFGAADTGAALFEFVNIREQCAWPHANNPKLATDKAIDLVAAAVAKIQLSTPRTVEKVLVGQTVLILGSGAAAQLCRQALTSQGISCQQVATVPDRIQRQDGSFTVSQNSNLRQASVVVLAPDDSQTPSLLAAFGENGHAPRPRTTWAGLNTHRPGVFYCDPALDPAMAGEACAARVAAWLGRTPARSEPTKALVDPARCRACSTCIDICEFGAPQLVEDKGQRASWIDPVMCTGCGTCAAHCPSGAITAGYSTDAQLEVMLDAVLLWGKKP